MTRRSFVRMVLLAAAVAGGGCKDKQQVKGPEDTDGVLSAPKDRGAERVDREPTTEAPFVDEGELPGGSGPLKDVYFDFDRYDIRPDQRPTLEGNADWLNRNRGQSVLIEGHCDERGTEEYNLALGDRRANAAKAYLQTLGVPSARMQTISYGKAYPVDPRHNEEAWAKNRRAHFTLVAPKVGEARTGD